MSAYIFIVLSAQSDIKPWKRQEIVFFNWNFECYVLNYLFIEIGDCMPYNNESLYYLCIISDFRMLGVVFSFLWIF